MICSKTSMVSRKIFSLFVFTCLFSLCFCFSCSSSASAISPSQTGFVGLASATVKLGSDAGYDMSMIAGDSIARANRNGVDYISDIYIRFLGNIPAHSVLAVTVEISGNFNGTANEFKNIGAAGNNYWSLIDRDCDTFTEPGGKFNSTCTYWYYTSVADNQINLSPSSNSGSRIVTVNGSYSIIVQSGTYYTTTDAESFVLDTRRNQILDGIESKIAFDILPELKAIKEAIAGVDSAGIIASIESGNKQAHDDALAQKEATDKQTQQQKEQYEQEKEEEKQREDSANEEGGKLAGIFNITLLNPFAGIWELFNPGGCTSIPTIASWVHSEDMVYCSWWPQSIRATLTPVFSLSAMMLLFGFVAKWLGGNEGINVRIN